MLDTIQVLVPLAGPSKFFPAEEYHFPKPLVEVAGVPMIERVVENLKSLAKKVKFIFVVRSEDVTDFSIDKTLRLLSADTPCTVTSLRRPTQGALCSCLMAIDDIDLASPVVIANSDQIIEGALSAFVERFVADCAAACVLT